MSDPVSLNRNHHSPQFAEVAVDVNQFGGGDGVLTYAVPPALATTDLIGRMVWVPLRRKTALGWVRGVHGNAPDFAVRPISAVFATGFRLHPDQIALADWLSRETASSLYSTGALWFPPGVSHNAHERFELIDPDTPVPDDLSPAEVRLWHLLHSDGPLTEAEIRKTLGRVPQKALSELEHSGFVVRTVHMSDRLPGPKLARHVRINHFDLASVQRAPAQLVVLEFLERRSRVAENSMEEMLVPVAELLASTGASNATLSAMERKGILEFVNRPAGRRFGKPSPQPAPQLTREQSAAWDEIVPVLGAQISHWVLLHGVTGSGKTEIYLRSVAAVLAANRSAIVLVPEIALATQILRRFEARFPGEVALVHSSLSERERFENWEAIRTGQARVVIGPRSALFAPVSDLGLIVIDEEHDGAYKQDVEPRYHARAVAERIARSTGALLIAGSATPAIETWHRAHTGDYRLLQLPSRVSPSPGRSRSLDDESLELPPIEVVDLRKEVYEGRISLVSQPLREAVLQSLRRKEQAILLLNRRGMSTVIVCRVCGNPVMCPRCDSPLVFHQDKGVLLCHHCNFRRRPTRECEICSGGLNYLGAGTQRLEAEAKHLFPGARVVRWDRDSIRQHGGHDQLVRAVERGTYDIVVGTQMVAKGFDMPLVSTIGVIYGDASIQLPDFRATERTFQLITQVAGRAGRRTGGARVVVQAFQPNHYAIQMAANYDFHGFSDEELDFRRAHGYPPFGRLIKYGGRNRDDVECEDQGMELKRLLEERISELGVSAQVIGPAPSFISRLREMYQWQLLVRGDDAAIETLLNDLPSLPGWTVDVDPQSLL